MNYSWKTCWSIGVLDYTKGKDFLYIVRNRSVGDEEADIWCLAFEGKVQ